MFAYQKNGCIAFPLPWLLFPPSRRRLHNPKENDMIVRCELCGEPMPAGEEMFKFHGYSGPCPQPPLPRPITPEQQLAEANRYLREIRESASRLARVVGVPCAVRASGSQSEPPESHDLPIDEVLDAIAEKLASPVSPPAGEGA